MKKNKKIKLLIIQSDNQGVGHFRSIWPAQEIERCFSDEIDVEINHQPNFENIEYFQQFDIVHFHRHIGPYERSAEIFPKIQASGTILIMDIDDYWEPPTTHPLYEIVKSENLSEKISNNLRLSDYVTTTTDIFSKYINKFNKNTKVIPNALNMEHPMWSSEVVENVSNKCRISWIGGSCYDDKTEILTENGFKLFKDLLPKEKVACLNVETDKLEFKEPNGYINEPFKGDMVCAETDLLNFSVTPNHNMYVSIADNLSEKKLDYKLTPSENVFNKNIHFNKEINFDGVLQENFILPKLKNTKLDKYKNDLVIPMNSWLKFFGFWIAEGWVTKSNNLYQVGICQFKDKKILDELYIILCEMGFNPKYTKDKCQIRIFDRRLWEYLNQFGYSYEKFIPNEIKNLDKNQLNILLKYFLIGDGSLDKNRWRAYTSSEKLANDLNEISLKIGLLSSVKNRGIRNSNKEIEIGRKINSKKESFVISIGSNNIRNRKKPLLRKEKMFKKYYDGNVYCVNVPGNIIYVRRNGKGMWCGNSHLHDLELMRPGFNQLWGNKELEGQFQIVMCGFDTRGSITEVSPNGEKRTRSIQPHETVWRKFEDIFSSEHKGAENDPEYYKWLNKIEKPLNSKYNKEQYEKDYVRRWTLPLTKYGTHYDYCDVCLAPIVDKFTEKVKHFKPNGSFTVQNINRRHVFNEVKSELKIIEAGMKKKVLIAQDFGIYSELIKDGVNGLLVNDDKKDWYKHMKKVITDPEYRMELANNLHEFVKDKYDIKNVTADRVKFYKEVIENKNKPIVLEGRLIQPELVSDKNMYK